MSTLQEAFPLLYCSLVMSVSIDYELLNDVLYVELLKYDSKDDNKMTYQLYLLKNTNTQE